jgi:hypothetical protein
MRVRGSAGIALSTEHLHTLQHLASMCTLGMQGCSEAVCCVEVAQQLMVVEAGRLA